jgi:hypothetical protein
MTTTPMIPKSPATKAGCPKGSRVVQKGQALITIKECIDEIDWNTPKNWHYTRV